METPNNEQKSEQKNEFENKPITETQISKSKDGKYIIHKTIIADIKPVKYYEKVLEAE